MVWDANRLRRSLMLTVLGWASSLHDPATYTRLYPAHLPAPKPATTSAAWLSHAVMLQQSGNYKRESKRC